MEHQKNCKRLVIAKRALTAKKVLCVIFFSSKGVAMPVKKGQRRYWKIQQRCGTKEIEMNTTRNDA